MQEEAGSGLVEFALTASILFTLVFGIMDCARAVYIDHFLAEAAREATRYAMVRGSSWGTSCSSPSSFSCTASSSDITAFVQSIASAGIKISNLAATTTWPGTAADGTSCSGTSTSDIGCLVSVRLTYSFSYVSPLLPRSALTLTSTSVATISQ